MKGTLFNVQVGQSIPAKLILDMEIENDNPTNIIWCLTWTGQVWLRQPRIGLGNLETKVERVQFPPHYNQHLQFYWEMQHHRLECLEEERKGGNLSLEIDLSVLQVSLLQQAIPGLTVQDLLESLRSDTIYVHSTGRDDVQIAKSEWEEKLGALGYGKVEYLELYLPPPPMGTSVDKALNQLTKAKENFNSGEYPDVLTGCRRAIDELQKLFSSEEERKTFFVQMLQDEKKAEAYSDLLETVQKAKNFASGGPHTYWVKVADRRDAEFALRITWAIIAYFAKNLAKAKG